MTASPAEIAKALYNAYASRDRAAAERLVAKDFHFTSPLDNWLSRETYFERCWPNNETTAGFDFVHVVEDGNRVFVTYELTATDGKRFRTPRSLRFATGKSLKQKSTLAGTCRTKCQEVGLPCRRRRREGQPHRAKAECRT
jgi:SnoaL-like domain